MDEETLSRYYKYLSARLTFPFTATYPEPRTALEEAECRCTVVELLDPAQTICDEFDGIRCRIPQGEVRGGLAADGVGSAGRQPRLPVDRGLLALVLELAVSGGAGCRAARAAKMPPEPTRVGRRPRQRPSMFISAA